MMGGKPRRRLWHGTTARFFRIDLVIVRMGHMRGQSPARRSTNAALQAVMEAVGSAQN
jgi:hypothetical protein